MSQAEWMWVKIYNLSMHEPCAPTKWIKKPQITNLIHQILLIPTLRWDSLKKTSKKKIKERMECFLTFWSVIINLLLKIVRKKKRSPELKFVVRYRSVNAENFLLPLCRLRVQSPGNGDLGALFHKREKYLEALGFQCVLSATHFTIAEKVQYNSSLPRPSHGWVRVSEGSEKGTLLHLHW